jgi:hypothetical protein
MKNIHVLPTEKPSRLYLTTHEYIFEEGYSLPTDECENKNIYITNDEEIKEGDWKLDTFHNQISKVTNMISVSKYDKKIILTTDQDLIKDGVQPIDDEFLQWFVKNPSCERVEVKCYSKFNDGDFSDYKIFEEKLKHINKIIIPKEELLQGAILTPKSDLEPDTVCFSNERKEMLKLCPNGDIFVHGRLADNDKEVVDALREFLTKQDLI